MINSKTTRTWREINLDAIKHNIKEVRKRINEHTIIMGVVKADAYGHGSVEVSNAMLSEGVSMLAVAEKNEAVKLRKAGIDAPILILGPENTLDIPDMLEYSITSAINSTEYARALSNAAQKAGKTAKAHIKLDTGMTRVGFNTTVDALKEIIEISKLPHLYIEGIFSHFACADMLDKSATEKQFQAFVSFTSQLEKSGVKIPIKHIANSAAIMRFPEYQLDMVRSGIISYGYSPLEDAIECDMKLKPAMTLKSRITRINTVSKGVSVSYGHTYTSTADETKIATVPIGYADGLFRLLSGKTHALAGGKYVPLIGRICMDQCMIDVTSVNNINIGDEVIIFGDGENCAVTADTLARTIGTISYEIVCAVSERVPRIFKSGNDYI